MAREGAGGKRWVKIALLFLGIGGVGLGALGVAVAATPGGSEELIARSVSMIRIAFPSLTGPIERLELFVQEQSYALEVWRNGQPEELHALPSDRIVEIEIPVEEPDEVPAVAQIAPETPPVEVPPEAPKAAAVVAPQEGPVDLVATRAPDGSVPKNTSMPGLGPHKVPEVPFDPAILDTPLEWTAYPGAPAWVQVSWPVPNPSLPDDHVLVVRFESDASRAHWQPGISNPWPMTRDKKPLADATPAPDRSGRVPKEMRDRPFVAFGGGFESMHFTGYGGIHKGSPLVRMGKGTQTMAIFADGRTHIGPWGSFSTDGLLEARQNLPPLVHEGKIPANIAYLNQGSLGSRHTKDADGHITYTDVHTWRSALGRAADGDLVYLFGPRLTPLQLAVLLIRAGAVDAMQLDINAAYHAMPTLFTPEGTKIRSESMYPGFKAGGTRFVNGSPKDFFYITDADLGMPGADAILAPAEPPAPEAAAAPPTTPG